MLVYRSCRCCRRMWSKLLHTTFHLLAVPCIVMGFIAAWDYHARHQPPIPHLYSIHSWMGLATMAMFLLQFVSGLFSFLLLMCCSSATASCRYTYLHLHCSRYLYTSVSPSGLRWCRSTRRWAPRPSSWPWPPALLASRRQRWTS